MCDLSLERYPLLFFFNLIEVDTIFIGKRVKYIHVVNCIFPSLLVAVNQVDPVVYILGDVPAL